MLVPDFLENYNPADLDIRKYKSCPPRRKGAFHEQGNKQHPLDDYKQVLYSKLGDSKELEMEIWLEWNICPECNQIRNKRLVGIDHTDEYETAYVRELIRHGETL